MRGLLFSRMPPTGSTSPLSVISPVMATSSRIGSLRILNLRPFLPTVRSSEGVGSSWGASALAWW
jgi:hypothetical protein